MSVTMPRVMLTACLVCSALLGSSVSWALGLGEIHLNSSLNEPMNAEIDLVAAAPEEVASLRASLASRDAFTRYGIDKPTFLSSLTFKVGKGKSGRDALLVRSTDAIPEPFVTFLVEVNWARGRLMREYTVLLDPPVYTPGESAPGASSNSSAPPVLAPTTAAPAPPVRRTAPPSEPIASVADSSAASAASAASPGIRVGEGDTLTKIVRSLQPDASQATLDQAMIAVYRSNPDAFGGNINVLRQGAILRVPNADQIAALNQRDAMGEVRRQMDAWRGSESGGGAPSGHLRLVPPTAGGSATGAGTDAVGTGSDNSKAASAATQALKDRVKDLEQQLADSKRLIDLRSSELSALQHKLSTPAPAPTPAPATTPAPAVVAPSAPTTPPVAVAPSAATPIPTPPSVAPMEPPSAATPVPAPSKPVAAPPADSGSWIDWVAANWWLPLALLVVVLAGLGFAAMKRRRAESDDMGHLMEQTAIGEAGDPTSTLNALRRGNESFVVEESGPHQAPEFAMAPAPLAEASELKSADDTMSSETAVNLDQGDPLAEADFHMAYGLYDQAADLVRIALEREPDRRDLRLKLLEIYFVWGNKDAFLQTAKGLEASRDRAPAGEWDKILIMGKQICPDEPMFGTAAGSGRGAGALVDLNLEGGENRVDIDLFGDPEGERSTLDHQFLKDSEEPETTGESPGLHTGSGLDFTLDAPERGADDSPTREMPPRDEPTVESELWHDRISSKLPTAADQTAEVSVEDLGLDLDSLEQTGSPSISLPHLDEIEHPVDAEAPTMVAGLDDRSRRMMEDAEKSSRERDLSELERELESSFVSDLGPDGTPTVMMPREPDQSPTSRFKALDLLGSEEREKDLDSTSKLRALSSDSVDLDLDRLASALGTADTVEQPRADEDLFSSEVFEGTHHNKLVDLDVGVPMSGSDAPTHELQAQTNRLKPLDLAAPDMEPVTMSEVGTKLDLARAYMDMGDPEGARSILEEVVQEGSASQKQEASRLIESLPG